MPGDVDNQTALIYFIISVAMFGLAVYFGVTEGRAEFRAWRRKRINRRSQEATEALLEEHTRPTLDAIAERWSERNITVTRYGDKRYRDGAISQLLG